METLQTTIEKHTGKQSFALLKHLSDCFGEVPEWGGLSKTHLNEFREYLLENVSQASARTYAAALKAVIKKYCETDICPNFAEILTIRNEQPMKIYLTVEELERLENVQTRTANERLVKLQFIVGAYTGARISDIMNLTEENIQGSCLRYVSQKTKVCSTIPCKPCILDYLKEIKTLKPVTVMAYNQLIRKLCKFAGIDERVKVFKAGKDLTGEKWQFVSSHTARVSFCTNLAGAGTPLLDISRMAGHTNTATTERYIVQSEVKLNDKAMEYFK